MPPVSARGLNLWKRLVPCNEDKVSVENIENSALLSTNRPRRELYATSIILIIIIIVIISDESTQSDTDRTVHFL